MPRNFKQEQAQHRTPKARKNDILRKRARRAAVKAGRVKPNDGKELDHIKMLSQGGSNAASNTRVVSRSVNRRKQPKTKTQTFAKKSKKK